VERRLRIAVDTGGTFTDFVVLDEFSGKFDVFKVPSTRGSEADGIVAGLRGYLERIGAAGREVVYFSHGTTVGTNAMLEENGAKTGLLVTAGFRGIYEVGEQSRPYGATTYDLFFERPHALVPARLTEEIPERLLFDGSVLEELDEAATVDAIRTLVRHGVTSIAVALLFSFRNPAHERRVGELIAREAPGVNVSLSSNVAPQIREYYRLSSTVVNAYLNPKLEAYIDELDRRLTDEGSGQRQRYIMRSNGGVATFESAARRSVQTILSGPAAGVVAATRLTSGSRDFPNVVTFDMGGTSTDVALIENGRPVRRTGGKIHGRDVQVSMLDIHTVAAGGGTIAWIDTAGVLQVGPKSAGANPGPACYGQGGTQPTITDANVVLGALSEESPLAGGTLRIDRAAAEKVIRERIAEPLGISVVAAARGIVEIVSVKMQEAIKVVSSNRGYDLRDFHLLAFGGAGAIHAAKMAQELGMRGVLVPAFPGVTSALGLLLSDVRHDYVVSKLSTITETDLGSVAEIFGQLRAQGESELRAQGFAAATMSFEYSFDLRYVGQGYDLTVVLDDAPLDEASMCDVRIRFDAQHAQLTGHSAPDEHVEIVNYRLTAIAAVPQVSISSPFAVDGTIDDARLGERQTWIEGEQPRATALYDRAKLPANAEIDGPAILLQNDATTVVGTGQRARVVELGQIEIVDQSHVAQPSSGAGSQRAVDAVTFQVIQSRLSGIVSEMQDSIFRTGYSTIIRESQDASCMLLDADGNVVGENVVLPLHVSALPEVVRAVRRDFDDIVPGDAFITNHPYLAGVTHSMDMAVVTPVFHGGVLIAFTGSIAHKSDLGGVVPGTSYGSARELFQEGIQYPPIRFVAAGAPLRDVEAILRANSRTPDLVIGDIRGQVGVGRLGERRIADLIERYGIAPVLETFTLLQDVTERRIRAVLATWPDGVHEAETYVDTDGITLDQPVRYHVRIEKKGDRIAFDFTDCNDQTQGPVNISPSLARGCCYYAMIATIDPGLPNNAGVARVVETTFRKGSVVDPNFPAPCCTYMASTTAIVEAMLNALSEFVPARRMAGNGGVGGISITGRRPAGGTFVQYEPMGSAYGGRATSDGVSGIAVLLSNTRTASIEVLESEFPTRVRRFELIRDSGGPGRYRGGLSPRRVWEILVDDAQLTCRGGKHTIPPAGVDGGKPGALGSLVLNAGTPGEKVLPSRFSGVRLMRGDRLRMERAGGGGLGSPNVRPFEAILADVLDGYVSREAAVRDYAADAAKLDEAIAAWAGAAVLAR
jgi:N-methylhydantoinase A/oxoprolinase/acetone carboxylase beta subunit/N-methylhydantoinase B/oxoprolinase/acetone carboxylase alpha subunit